MGSIFGKRDRKYTPGNYENVKGMHTGGSNRAHNIGSTHSLNVDQGEVSLSPRLDPRPGLEQAQNLTRHKSLEDFRGPSGPILPPRVKSLTVPGQKAESQIKNANEFEDYNNQEDKNKKKEVNKKKEKKEVNKKKDNKNPKETNSRESPTADSDAYYASLELDSKSKVRADRNYEKNYGSDISFRKGDILQLIRDGEVDGYYFAINLRTVEEGRVPTNWVTMITTDDVELQTCFFKGMNREEAEEKLLQPGIELGTYLLRPSKDGYALSLRCENKSNKLEIRHYRLRVVEKGKCFIDAETKSETFSNCVELIKHYTEKTGLRCKLKTPLTQDVPLEDLAVKYSDLELGEELGSGNYGSVYAGTLHKNKEVAVKSLKAGSSMTVEDFRKEAKTMHTLRHPKLVSLLAICEGSGNIYIITERMSKGALLDLLREDTDNTIKFKDIIEMAIQVAEGMCYLEEKAFVHRDLRAANVLIDGNIAKIADFGLARLLDDYYGEEEFYKSKKGSAFPYKWTALEAATVFRFTVKSDVWSFGILLFEMVTHGVEPYAGMANHEVIQWLDKGNRLEKPTRHHCPLALYNIMKQCWLLNSNERPNFVYIKDNLMEINRNG